MFLKVSAEALASGGVRVSHRVVPGTL